MTYTPLLYIIGPFFSLKKVAFLSFSFVWHSRTQFPTVICTCNFVSLFYIFFNFSFWRVGGGEVSDTPIVNRNGCLRYLYQEMFSSKNVFRVYFPSIPPHYVLYLSRHLRCFYYQCIKTPYLLPKLFFHFRYCIIVYWYYMCKDGGLVSHFARAIWF